MPQISSVAAAYAGLSLAGARPKGKIPPMIQDSRLVVAATSRATTIRFGFRQRTPKACLVFAHARALEGSLRRTNLLCSLPNLTRIRLVEFRRMMSKSDEFQR